MLESNDKRPRAVLQAANRTLAAVLGGYALTLAFTAAATLALQRGAQWGRGEAMVTAGMLAFVVYLLVALRAFVAPSSTRAWGELLAAAAGLATMAWVLG